MISVVVPLYNKEAFIRKTLISILSQTFQDFEVIVVNDGSTDGGPENVASLKDSRIRLINQKNGGVCSARNRGTKDARGEYVAFLDADDEWDKDYLETIKNLIDKYPECNVFATNYRFKFVDGKIRNTIQNKIHFCGEGKLDNYFEVASCSNPPICSSAVCVNRTALTEIGGFPLNIKSGEDLLTWSRLAVHNKIAYCTIPKASYILSLQDTVNQVPTRPHDEIDYVGNELISMLNMVDAKQRIHLKHYISMWFRMRASMNFRYRDVKGSWKYGLKALRYNIRNTKVYLMMGLVLMPNFIQDKIKNYYVKNNN